MMKSTRFEARSLKPYAEPLNWKELEIGEVYFSLNYCDSDMLFPILEPLVFLGLDLEEGDEGLVYFQDYDSYFSGVRYEKENESDVEAYFCQGEAESMSHIFDYEHALNELMSCSLRRRSARLDEA